MRKDRKWTWAIIVAVGLGMVVLIVGIVMYAAKGNQSPSDNPALRNNPSLVKEVWIISMTSVKVRNIIFV